MLVYICAFLFSIILGILFQQKTEYSKIGIAEKRGFIHREKALQSWGLFVGAIPVFFISAVRYGIGTDYFYTYYPMFQRIAEGDTNTHYEIGFLWLNKIIVLFTDNPQWLFVVTSFIFVFFAYYAISKVSSNYALSIIVLLLSYTFFVSLNNVRQSMASAIIFIAIAEYWNNHKYRSIVLVMIAGLFHKAAFLFLIMFVVDGFFISANIMLLIVAAAAMLSRYMADLIIRIAMMIPRLGAYFTQDDLIMYRTRSISMTMIILNIVLMIMLCVIEYNNIELFINRDRKWNFVKWNQAIYIGLCGLDGIVPAMYRIVRIFSFTQFLVIPYVLSCEKDRDNRIILTALTVLVFFLLFIKLLLGGSEEVIPYQSIFGK